MYFDNLEIWFANGQILSIFDRFICLQHDSGEVLSFHIFFITCHMIGMGYYVSPSSVRLPDLRLVLGFRSVTSLVSDGFY